MLEQVKKMIQQNDRFGKLLGVEILEVSEGHSVSSLTVTEEHLNAADVAHGGAVFTLADIALAVASNSYGKIALLTNATITFFRATQAGETLIATAEEIGGSRKLGHYRVEIKNAENDSVAVYTATVYRTGKPLSL